MATINIHHVKRVKVFPVESLDGAIWQRMVVEFDSEFEKGELELVLFPLDPNKPLMQETK